jgi:hypothetical protein
MELFSVAMGPVVFEAILLLFVSFLIAELATWLIFAPNFVRLG